MVVAEMRGPSKRIAAVQVMAVTLVTAVVVREVGASIVRVLKSHPKIAYR